MGNDNNNDRNKIRRKKVSSSSNNSTTQKKSTTSNRSSSSRTSRKKSRKKDTFKTLRAIGVLFLVLLVLGVAAGTALVFVALKDVQPITKAALDKKINTVTKLEYSDGSYMGSPPSENQKKPIPITDMPLHLQHALVAIEDERFYEHHGVDFKGLARAAVINILSSSSPGGSTIPMQVSKNLITSKEVSIVRKIKDIYYALEMDKELTKQQILELYLNSAYFGRGAIGVEAAANAYFSIHAKDLSIAQSAMIVGITQNPNKYAAYDLVKLTGNETKEDVENKLKFYVNTKDDNFDDPTQVELNMIDKLDNWGLIPKDYYKQLKDGSMVVRKAVLNEKSKKRQETVLMKMLELGYLTQDEHDKAVAEKIDIKLPKPDDSKPATTVEDLIEKEVITALANQGYTESEANNLYFNGGLTIRTTLDKNIQKGLETEFDDVSNFPNSITGVDGVLQPQAAMVILDYRTGEIKALMGGRNIKARKVANRATTPHQPGSTIKPLSVYTPAIDNGKTQADTFSDAPNGYKFKYENGWSPKTTTAGRGSMTMRKALAYSSNTIAVKVAETLGDSQAEAIDVMIDYLKNFGLSDLKDGPGGSDRNFPALTLGGMTTGASPLDMAAAYGTLANGGVYIEPITFTTVTTSDDQILIQNTPEEHRVVSEDVAYVMTDMMKAVVTQGTGGAASFGDMPVAGKTGTTNGNKDAWFVGYTPYYVGATYIGDDYQKDPETKQPIARRGVNGGSKVSAKLWSKVMKRAHTNLNKIDFKKPSGIEFVQINLTDGGIVSKGAYNSASAAFIKGHLPSKYSSQPSAPIVEEEVPEEEVPPPTTNVPEEEGTPTQPPANNTEGTTTDNNTENNNNNNNVGGNTTTPVTPETPTVVSPPANQ